MQYTRPTAARPPAKANSWMKSTFSDRKIPSTAPSAAPVDTPRMSGDTSGLRNMPWYAVPAAASAAPTISAASTRGPRTCSTTVSTFGLTSWPNSTENSSLRETG